MGLVLQRETHGPTILARRVKRLRESTGNPSLVSALKSPKTPKELFFISIIRPTKNSHPFPNHDDFLRHRSHCLRHNVPTLYN